MNWLTLFAAIAALLKDVLPQILDLFKTADKTGAMPEDAVRAVNEALDRAHARTWWIQFRVRAQLREARASVVTRADALVAQARGVMTAAPLTAGEVAKIGGA